MELIRGLHNVRPRHQGCVATIGNFDGVHLGHQHVLDQTLAQAKKLQLPSVVIIFEPQPLEFFTPDKAKARLTRLREKVIAFQNHGIDRVLLIRFNQAFAALSPQQFIDDILVGRLGIRYLIVGDDFRFGHRREGDFALLQREGERHHFEVSHTETLLIKNRRVSSSWVREALAMGDLKTVETILGRTYSMCGRVAHGDKLGRQLGYPTANIYLHRDISPISGVFVVTLEGIDALPLEGVASVGDRPTVCGQRSLLEVYLFNFDRDIYGRYVKVNFLHKLRDQEKFDSLELLREQIEKDVVDAKKFFDE